MESQNSCLPVGRMLQSALFSRYFHLTLALASEAVELNDDHSEAYVIPADLASAFRLQSPPICGKMSKHTVQSDNVTISGPFRLFFPVTVESEAYQRNQRSSFEVCKHQDPPLTPVPFWLLTFLAFWLARCTSEDSGPSVNPPHSAQ